MRHKALRRLIETGNPRGLDCRLVDRLYKMIAFLAAIEEVEELLIPPNWGVHPLTGDRAGSWSLTVTRNWRMTFVVTEAHSIEDLDLEDYH